jgi:hydroxymethylbilane synthase
MSDPDNGSGPFRLIVSINLEKHEILVVGGGGVALRKITTLLRRGARVRMVSPDAVRELSDMASNGDIIWERRFARDDDFASHCFAVLAVPISLSRELAAMARSARCAADVCAEGSDGDFALCAQFEADGCFVGVSSGGRDPVRAAALKRKILKTISEPIMALARKSPLAMAQAAMWTDALASAGFNATVRTVTSHGDNDLKSELSSFGFGAFVKALEDELLNGRGDCAIHSMKDVPTVPADGCILSGVLKRGSVRDVLVTRDGTGLDSLPPGARVGTSSVRRRAQIGAERPDVVCVKCRGNVGTRLEKLASGEVDALALAEAGLERLGESARTSPLPFVTSAGQGAVVAEAVAGSPADKILRSLNHLPTWYEVTAERGFLSRLALGCVCPVGVNARYDHGMLEIAAEVYPMTPGPSPERASVSGSVGSGEDAVALADDLWEAMRDMPVTKEMAKGALKL